MRPINGCEYKQQPNRRVSIRWQAAADQFQRPFCIVRDTLVSFRLVAGLAIRLVYTTRIPSGQLTYMHSGYCCERTQRTQKNDNMLNNEF